MTGKGGIFHEGYIGMAKVGTGTAMWECLVLSNEEGHAFSTPIRLGDNPEGEGCVKRDNGAPIGEEFYGFFRDNTANTSIVITGLAGVWDEPHDIGLLACRIRRATGHNDCRCSRICLTTGHN